jgi:hypothetical protein
LIYTHPKPASKRGPIEKYDIDEEYLISEPVPDIEVAHSAENK